MQEFFSNAAWVIMDPWTVSTSTETIKYPDLDNHNYKTWLKIKKILPLLKHPLVSIGSHHSVYSELEKITNIGYDLNKLLSYIKVHRLKNIVYCGFHYGTCILYRPTGAAYVNPYFNLNMQWKEQYKNFKGSDWPDILELTQLVDQNKNLKNEIESIPILINIWEKYSKNQNYYDKNKNINVFIKKDLCSLYPDTIEKELDQISKSYATLI